MRAALDGFNGLPILTRHVPVSADDHRGDLVVGSTGSSATLVNGEVTELADDLGIAWDRPDRERRGTIAELWLCLYTYRAVGIVSGQAL